MSRHVVKLPDLGEGTVSSEIVAWRVKVGDAIKEDEPMVEMATDKAVVEMPAPVSGRVVSLAGEPGDHVAVGAELIVLETDANAAEQAPSPTLPRSTGEGAGNAAASAASASRPAAPSTSASSSASSSAPIAAATSASSSLPRFAGEGKEIAATLSASSSLPRSAGEGREGASKGRVMASPATRRRAREAGIDLKLIEGSGRDGRIQKQDLEAALEGRARPGAAPPRPAIAGRIEPRTETEEIRILGVRRVSAQRVAESKRNIPHFAYVEEIDITELERLRKHLNSKLPEGAPSFTYLPFLAMALVRVLEKLPKANARFDAERNVIVQHRGVHLGVATQTSTGLKVPVVRHAETMSLHELSSEIRRVTEAARNGTASRTELMGSTITITSLGKLGGIVSTPIINAPEVAIIGVNKAVERPMVCQGAIAVRLMMNLSSSFDHRFIDGYDAAETIQALKERLEQPATIFIPD